VGGVVGVVGMVGVGVWWVWWVWGCGGVGWFPLAFEHSKVCTLCDFGHLQFYIQQGFLLQIHGKKPKNISLF
jgi:hypothetical protein